MTTGSHHLQFYWYSLNQDRELGQLPFVFLFRENRWVPADSTFLRPTHKPLSNQYGIWNQNCVKCHSTGAQPRLEQSPETGEVVSTDTRVAEFGISCEACHGPGEEHVAKHSNAFSHYQTLLGMQDELHAVHPDEVPSQRRSPICGQCHGTGFPSDLQHMRQIFWDGYAYRAGDDLLAPDSDRILVQNDLQHPMIAESVRRDPGYLPSYFWSDGMVRIAGREFNGLIRSPCFQHDDDANRLQRMSCHQLYPSDLEPANLEAWSDDQLAPGMRTNQACTQCHHDYADSNRLAKRSRKC